MREHGIYVGRGVGDFYSDGDCSGVALRVPHRHTELEQLSRRNAALQVYVGRAVGGRAVTRKALDTYHVAAVVCNIPVYHVHITHTSFTPETPEQRGEGLLTVSYTHLDVYKRQLLNVIDPVALLK